MAGYVEGVDRTQATLFPDRLEDYVGEDNPVRVVDACVEALDLRELGFSTADDGDQGRLSRICRIIADQTSRAAVQTLPAPPADRWTRRARK